MLCATEMVGGLMAEETELDPWLVEYKVFKKNLQRKVSEQSVIIKAIKRSVKQLQRKLSTLQDENSLLRRAKVEVRDSFGKEKQ